MKKYIKSDRSMIELYDEDYDGGSGRYIQPSTKDYYRVIEKNWNKDCTFFISDLDWDGPKFQYNEKNYPMYNKQQMIKVLNKFHDKDEFEVEAGAPASLYTSYINRAEDYDLFFVDPSYFDERLSDDEKSKVIYQVISEFYEDSLIDPYESVDPLEKFDGDGSSVCPDYEYDDLYGHDDEDDMLSFHDIPDPHKNFAKGNFLIQFSDGNHLFNIEEISDIVEHIIKNELRIDENEIEKELEDFPQISYTYYPPIAEFSNKERAYCADIGMETLMGPGGMDGYGDIDIIGKYIDEYTNLPVYVVDCSIRDYIRDLKSEIPWKFI